VPGHPVAQPVQSGELLLGHLGIDAPRATFSTSCRPWR
jgi:hypothetical protein